MAKWWIAIGPMDVYGVPWASGRSIDEAIERLRDEIGWSIDHPIELPIELIGVDKRPRDVLLVVPGVVEIDGASVVERCGRDVRFDPL